MKDHSEKYDEIMDRFVSYGKDSETVRSAIVIGSRGRDDVEADEWSDLDIVVFSEEPDHLLSEKMWLEDIGEYWLTFLEDTPIGDTKERRVLFEGALDVDFAILPSENFDELKKDDDIRSVLSRGYKVLIDKDGLFDDIEFALDDNFLPEGYHLPSEKEFHNLVKDFWYHSVWSGKKLLRGEVWIAKSCVDGYMKSKLMKMIEWYMVGIRGGSVRSGGRFFEEWAEGSIMDEIVDCFAHYDEADIGEALVKTMDLFRVLAVDLADELGYEYDKTADRKCTGWVEDNLFDR